MHKFSQSYIINFQSYIIYYLYTIFLFILNIYSLTEEIIRGRRVLFYYFTIKCFYFVKSLLRLDLFNQNNKVKVLIHIHCVRHKSNQLTVLNILDLKKSN